MNTAPATQPAIIVVISVSDASDRIIDVKTNQIDYMISISLPFASFTTWRVNRIVWDRNALTSRIIQLLNAALPHGAPMLLRCLVLENDDQELREMLNVRIIDAFDTMSADTEDARAAARAGARASLALHFAPDRVNTFISHVMNGMPGDEYLPYKILLSAGIYRVYAQMVRDIDAATVDVRDLVSHTIGGPWTWSNPWCIDNVVKFVSSRA